MTTSFNSVQKLYEDMLSYCKNFTLGLSEGTAVFGEITYSNYEFKNFNFENGNNQLDFWQSSGKDGANLTLRNIVSGKRIGDPSTDDMFEYRFLMKDKTEPFNILAFRWARGAKS